MTQHFHWCLPGILFGLATKYWVEFTKVPKWLKPTPERFRRLKCYLVDVDDTFCIVSLPWEIVNTWPDLCRQEINEPDFPTITLAPAFHLTKIYPEWWRQITSTPADPSLEPPVWRVLSWWVCGPTNQRERVKATDGVYAVTETGSCCWWKTFFSYPGELQPVQFSHENCGLPHGGAALHFGLLADKKKSWTLLFPRQMCVINLVDLGNFIPSGMSGYYYKLE